MFSIADNLPGRSIENAHGDTLDCAELIQFVLLGLQACPHDSIETLHIGIDVCQ